MVRLSNEVILKMSKLKTECYFFSTPYKKKLGSSSICYPISLSMGDLIRQNFRQGGKKVCLQILITDIAPTRGKEALSCDA